MKKEIFVYNNPARLYWGKEGIHVKRRDEVSSVTRGGSRKTEDGGKQNAFNAAPHG